jgi:chemotaxis response regulator CheB
MMAAQLDAATALSVRFPKAGERLRHGEAVVAPSDQRLSIDDSGHVQLQPASGASPYSPSIDQLVSDAIERLGDRVTLILFSGMGSDGLEGARQLIARGGQVWVQERSSCVVASMIDGVKSQGLVRFEGSPAELADRVLEVLS